MVDAKEDKRQVAVKDRQRCQEKLVRHLKSHLGKQKAQVQKSSLERKGFDSCPLDS